MLGLDDVDELNEDQRLEMLDTFKELINIAAGAALTDMRKSIATCRLRLLGRSKDESTISNLNLFKTKLQHPSGN